MKTPLYGINENGNRKEAWTPTYQGPISLLPPLNTQPMSNKDQHRAPNTALCLKLTNHPLGGKLTTLCPSEIEVIDPHRNGYIFQVWVSLSYQQSPSHTTKEGLTEFLIDRHGIPHSIQTKEPPHSEGTVVVGP